MAHRHNKDVEDRQAEQARLVELARKEPGVEEALAAYRRLQGQVPSVAISGFVGRYATGTNR